MKKFLLYTVFLGSLILAGCSREDNSIVGPTTQNNSISEKPNWLKAAEAQGVKLLSLPPSTEQSLKKSSFVTKYVFYNRTSILSIRDFYKSNDRFVLILASLTIRPYSLNNSDWITMGFADDYLVSNVSLGPVDMNFGPDGTSFNKPALLNIIAQGLDLSNWSQDDDLKLACFNEDTQLWEVVPCQKIIFNVKTGFLQCVNGQLSHFSRYGFIK
jgi:hypothetical protein